MPLLPSNILNKRYRIVSLLAEGGYGAVYRAWDMVAKQDVVVKSYHDASVETQKLIRAEARQLSQLNHPQLPKFLDHFAVEGFGQYLVSEYVDGIDLQSLLDQYGPLPSDLIIGWLQAATEPVNYLHQQKRLHLDLKPANIRVTPAGDVFLVDTGLPGLGIRPFLPPHAGYGAPEQQAQTAVSPASDIYSLGAILYTLLTNQAPPNALERESGLSDLKPAREVNPNIEPYLSLVAQRAMSLRDDSRYESVTTFAQTLNRPTGHAQPTMHSMQKNHASRAAGHAITHHAPPVPPPRLPVSRRRQMERRTIFGLSLVLIMVLGVLAAFGYVNIERPSDVTEAEATATIESAVVAALTAIAPTSTPIPAPTTPPTPTPAPLITQTDSQMLYVPGGIFRLGNDEGERDEQPSLWVRLDPYYIDETEVTNGAYAQCVEAGACEPPDSPGAAYHEAYYGDPRFDDYPVIFVNWYDASDFCLWRDARLPSEAEWEKAASLDPDQAIKFRYPWGDAFDGEKLNYCDANCPSEKANGNVNDGHRDTAPVRSYENGRSTLGVYDMAGNVMEWVSDWYSSRYYETAPDTNPLGPPEGDFKAIRGGSWLSTEEELTTTTRSSFDPTVSRTNLGFRCATAVP
ncbi:MAG: bifunctional serine/threonine-protein kinase/formylglycine-generating enzyme family protein [Chloroflexota bacterium]